MPVRLTEYRERKGRERERERERELLIAKGKREGGREVWQLIHSEAL